MTAQQYDLFLRHFNTACRGAIVMFFVVSVVVLIINLRKRHGYSVVHAKHLSLLAMIIEILANMGHIAINVWICLDSRYTFPLHNELFAMVEMVVMLIAGMALLSLVRLRPMPRGTITVSLLPLVAAIVAYYITGNSMIYNFAIIYTCAYLVAIVILAHVLVYRYEEVLKQTFANTTAYAVRWVLACIYAFIVLFGLWVLQSIFTVDQLVVCLSIIIAQIPWSIYMYFILQVRPIDDYVKDIVDGSDDDKAPQVKTWQWQGFGDAIREYCMREEVFGNTELTIIDVARAVGTNRTYISRWCKEQGLDFSSYIRRIRLDFAVDLLLHTDLTMDQIATKAGFYTQRSFRVAFMARYGCTPRDYVLNHLHEK